MDELFEAPSEGLLSDANNSAPSYPQLKISELETEQLIQVCNAFKRSAVEAAKPKKESLETAQAYLKNKFVGNDLLPLPSTDGGERDIQKNRPQVFIPVCRQQAKTIYAQLKLILFPNDEDFFRVRAKTAQGMEFEDTLTNGLKYILRENDIPNKLGFDVYNTIWAGYFATMPTARFDKVQEWQIVKGQPVIDPDTGMPVADPVTGDVMFTPDEYQESVRDLPPKLDLESFNPLDFYIDPTEKDPERIKWVHCCDKKYQDLIDSPYYINKDQLSDMLSDQQDRGAGRSDSSSVTDISKNFSDKPGFIKYDLYYFPYLELTPGGKVFRNVFVGVAGEQLLVRFHPNMLPGGMNPVVFQNWSASIPDDAYSMGPVEDLINLQKIINILYNYKLEVMARSGNRFVVRPSVDVKGFFGVAGGLMVADDPRQDVVNLSGNFNEIASLDNTIGILKAEAQLLSGAQNPFQGSSNMDFKKTATELTILQEGSISILREVATNLSHGIRRVIERFMYIAADLYTEPMMIPNEDAYGMKQFVPVNFAMLRSGEFTIEIISANPSQSKQAQVNSLKELLEFITNQPPEVTEIMKPVIEKIGTLNGLNDVGNMLDKMKERLNAIQQQQNGMGPPPQPPMAGPPPAVAA